MGIFGNDANSYFGADNYKNLDIGNMAYKDYGSYTPYSSNISSQAGDLISQFMSGKLSPEVLAQANKGFMSANEATREGSYRGGQTHPLPNLSHSSMQRCPRRSPALSV